MLDRLMARCQPYAPLALRITVAVIFIAHGAQKLFGVFGGYGIAGTARFFEQMGIEPGTFWAVVVGLTEFLGGIAVLAGMFTRYAATLLSFVMLVAIFKVHLPNGFFLPNGIEYAFALFGANVVLLMGGAGEFSLDHYIRLLIERRRATGEPTATSA